jgi:hypothetical protein
MDESNFSSGKRKGVPEIFTEGNEGNKGTMKQVQPSGFFAIFACSACPPWRANAFAKLFR